MVRQHFTVGATVQKGQRIRGTAGAGDRHQDDLLNRLNDEEKEIFEKYSDCSNEMHDITEREAFVKGFTIGAQIIIAVLTAGETK